MISLVYKVITSNRASDDISTGFIHDRNMRRDELTGNKNIKGKFHVRITLKDVFGFAEHHEKATFVLGYKLTLTKIKDDAALDKAAAIADARKKIDHIYWYVPHYTPSNQQQGLLS